MKRKTVWIIWISVLTIVIGTPVWFIYLLNNGNPYTKYLVNKHVPPYIEEKGYKADELIESHYTQPKSGMNQDFYEGHYRVIFNDEPDITYYYGVTKKGKHVKQFCEKDHVSAENLTTTIETELAHSEKDCVNSQDNWKRDNN